MGARVLYRNDEAFGDGYRDAAEVIAYEIFELGNFDSLHYMFRNYRLSRELRRKWRGYFRELLGNGYVDDMSDDELTDEVRELLDAIAQEVGKPINYVLWLASKSAVEQFYDGTENNIDAYYVSDAVVLSDLGEDGKLFGFEANPIPLERMSSEVA